jgi:hypothetical protein
VKVVADQRIEQLRRDARAANRVDRERIELFEAMIKSPGWVAYVEVLEAKLQMLSDQMFAPAGSVDRMVELEYVKGAMSGLLMARDIPAATIAAKDQLRATGAVEIDDED